MTVPPAPDFPFPSGRTQGEGPAAVPVQQPRSSAAGPQLYGERAANGWVAVLLVQHMATRVDIAGLRMLALQANLLADQFDGKPFE